MSLNEKSMALLKGIIAARLAVLREEIGAGTARAREESYGALTGGVVDRGDEASADLIADIGNAEVARDARELRALEAALARMEAGEYGACADCAEPIAFERLKAEPGAPRCIACQRQLERRSGQPNEPRL
jgi:DnaK suppressor protein